MFVGRGDELAELERLYATGDFQMVVLYGRRRVGKTTLTMEFARNKRTLYFTALEQSDTNNLLDFTNKIKEFFSATNIVGSFESWSAAFDFLAERAKEDPFVFVFDEFPYAALRNEALPSALQIAIDHKFKNTGLFMILCGSNQGFMESRVLGRKSPLFGRRTAQMRILPLGYTDARQMLGDMDAQDSFRFYGCFGGVPYYLSQVDPEKSLRENLARLYFSPSGFLYEEPMGLLRQELSEPALYSSILRAISAGANRTNELAGKTGLAATSLPKYLKTLIDLGLIERVVPFGENAQTSKRGIYRIKDACFTFWFRFVMPYVSDIEAGMGGEVLASFPDSMLDEYLGHRFEGVCLEWLVAQSKSRALPFPVTTVGSWWGTDPTTRSQTDIDVVAANRVTKQMIVGECRYRRDFNVSEVVGKLESKRGLVKGFDAKALYVFSRFAVSGDARSANPSVQFVSLDEL